MSGIIWMAPTSFDTEKYFVFSIKTTHYILLSWQQKLAIFLFILVCCCCWCRLKCGSEWNEIKSGKTNWKILVKTAKDSTNWKFKENYDFSFFAIFNLEQYSAEGSQENARVCVRPCVCVFVCVCVKRLLKLFNILWQLFCCWCCPASKYLQTHMRPKLQRAHTHIHTHLRTSSWE